jgi:phospholipase C
MRYLNFAVAVALVACKSSTPMNTPDMAMMVACPGGVCPTQSNIKHVVVVVQENHTFDNYFGKYCTAATGSAPTCTTGPACCEAGPAHDPSGASPVVLDDADNSGQFNDRNHYADCEVAEINGGAMDKFVAGATTVGGRPCSTPENFAYSPAALVQAYLDMAANGAIGDRYFQPSAGQSSQNDMYFARAAFVFTDNSYYPNAIGKNCMTPGVGTPIMDFTGTTVADLLIAKGVKWSWYGGGYATMKNAGATCPMPPADCAIGFQSSPCLFDASDVPFEYYASSKDKPDMIKDFDADFAADLAAGTLPPVSFVKAIGYKTEHPALKITISDGVKFVKGVVDAVAASSLASSTLVIVTYDEGGGFYDHVAPPATNAVDGKPYGTRVPFIAVGAFAKKNYVSHVTMEHSSIVKFIEWNWLGGATGQLMTRDATVNNIGDVLDPAKTGATVPSN